MSTRWISGCCFTELLLDSMSGLAWARAPGFEGHDQSDRGDDAAKGLERRLEAEPGDDEPGEHRRNRKRGVCDNVERGEHRGPPLGRDRCNERAEPAEIRDAEPHSAHARPDQK